MRYLYSFVLFSLIFFQNNYLFAQQDPIDLIATDELGILGREVSVDVVINKFSNIIAFQASINWDPAVLTYKQVSNFGIKDFDGNDFGTTTTAQGHLRFLWVPDDATAVTVADGTVLFTVTFEVISDSEASTALGFVDNTSPEPFLMEFSNDDYEVVNVNTTDGVIEIFSTASELVNITSTPNTSCDVRQHNGSLEANVNGDIGNFTFHWFIGSEVKSAPDFVGSNYDLIPAGDYTLQVLDGTNAVFVEKINTTVLDAPTGTPDVITEISNVPQRSCSNDALRYTGAIEIEVNDEQPAGTYNIHWWKGDSELIEFENAYVADKLDDGDYEVVVENPGTGCRSYYQTSVSEELVVLDLLLSATKNNFCKNGGNGSVSASASVTSNVDLRYYWFMTGDAIDTTNALSKGPAYENIEAGNYKSWVIDVSSECFVEGAISVIDSAIYPEPGISQQHDTLFANDEEADWFRNNSPLGKTGSYLVPEISGVYSISVANEYNCLAFSDNFFYGITGLDEINAEITIYPNPFDKFIRISYPEGGVDYIKVFDTRGVMIRELFDVKNRFTDLPLSGSSNGIYLIRIKKGNKILTRKVLENLSE
jgi:hypothetical protein